MNNNCLEIIDLDYDKLFKKFNLKIKNETFLTISGPNNCGKTTLIRIIDGQIPINNVIKLYGHSYESFNLAEMSNIIQTVIPLEITSFHSTVEDELLLQLSTDIPKTERNKLIKETAKKFKISKLLTKTVESLKDKEKVYFQLVLAIIKKPKILLIDDLYPLFNKQEMLEITKLLKEYNTTLKITIIMITSLLDCNLLSDYTYIISEGNIVLEGNPYEVLEKDNILNKAGLNLPFMMDLSVKLRDYDLIKEIELDMDRMVNTLWK